MEFFHALGVPVIEGYGLTETASSATVNEPGDFRIGTVGRPVDGAEIRLAEDGEILIRSDSVFAGYYKEPEATAAALTDDGWLRTGDVGEIDDEGFLRITDRKKDLIITAGGKNIAPQNLENALKASRFVSQALVVGDRRPYVTALVTLDEAELASSGRDPQELVQELVDDVNRDRTRVEQIKRFVILPRDFSQEEGEVTPTLKLRRRVIHEHFADEIEKLYVGQPAASPGSASRRRTRQRTSPEAVDPDDGAGVRRVDELSVADVDPDVAEPVEEDEVAGLELAPRHRDGIRVAPLRDGVVRQRDADLGVGVHDEARAVEAAGARAALHVRGAEVAHRDARRRRCSGARDRAACGSRRRSCTFGAATCARRDPRGTGGGLLGRPLRGDHLRDLGADGAVETPLGGEPPLDLVALRCARRDQPVLPGAFVAQQRPPVHDLVLEREHLVDERRVLLRHRVDGLDA